MHRPWVSNNWTYTLGTTFVVMNIIYFTKSLQLGDKAIASAMINIDQTIGVMPNITDENY